MADSPDDLEVKAIPASSAINAVRGASTVRLVILDACRDNPFAANPGWASGKRAFGSRGLGRELGRADNVVLLLATQPGTRASDGSGVANSPFARALAATLSADGLQIAELPTMVSRRMRQDDRVEQRPDQQGIFDEPRWMFRPGAVAGGGGPAAPPPPRPAAPVQALVAPAARPQAGAGNAAALIRECDRLAANEWDPDRPADAPFVTMDEMLPVLAVPACTRAMAAAPGNTRVLAQLGRAHYVAKDYAAALPALEQAAAAGSAQAMNNLGQMYWFGFGVDQDYVQARQWFEQAAAKGNAQSMENLGLWYQSDEKRFENGRGVTQDFAQARRWYEQAAAKGRPVSMRKLGTLYYNGQGVTQDYTQARNWFEQGAAKDDGLAMTWLGFLYATGKGVPKDMVQARRWYEQGAGKGNEDAKKWLAEHPR